jgi:hypothetical protein
MSKFYFLWMGICFFYFSYTFSLFSQVDPLPKGFDNHKSSDDDLKTISITKELHETPGCPTNSVCGRDQGIQKIHWNEFNQNLQKQVNHLTDTKKKIELEQYRQRWGIPVQYYFTQDFLESKFLNHPSSQSQTTHNPWIPIYWDSSCSIINPSGDKRKSPPPMIGESFVVSSQNESTWMVQNQGKKILIDQPLILFRPMMLINKKSSTSISYRVPLGDFPIYVDNQKMVLLKDDEGLYYYLSINSSNGEWKIVEKPSYQQHWQQISCPTEILKKWDQWKLSSSHKVYEPFPQEIFCYQSSSDSLMQDWILTILKLCSF